MTVSPLAIGLMSGTSADGISAALGKFHGHHCDVVDQITVPYPNDIANTVRQRGQMTVARASQLNVELGDLFAEAALKILKKAHTKAADVACIGSHGQTIYHGPSDHPKNTFQIADPAIIAEKTGITVVSDFRQRDIAVGGEGAPLIPFFDQYFFGAGAVTAMLNVGGIANVTIVGKGIDVPLAFDTGPGNCLMDLAVQEISRGAEHYDHHGKRAKHGKIDTDAVGRMILHPYFKKTPPKSTGQETFGREFLSEYLGSKLMSHSDDVLATLNYFTCLTVQESFRSHVFGKYNVTRIVVSGGGVFNKTLMKKLECLFAPIPVVSIESMGIPALAKEPAAFAFFGWMCLQHKINHLPSSTGAKAARVLGSITRA